MDIDLYKKYIDNIKYESERMSTLIKSLLDLSKLENKISVNNYKDENISKIVERICLTFEAVAFEENIKIKTDIEKYNKQYSPIEYIQFSKAVHDRFLIIDDVVYHMGASVKDMGKSLCAVTKMSITPQEIIDNITK